jgi:ATP-binding cassette subfamily B protein RaxB
MLNFSGRRALPVIMQSEASECGLACLAMVASYYGHRIDLGTLRRQHPISLNGVTLRSVIEIARHMNFTTRAVRLEPEDLKQIKRPAILHWDMNHFVVLKSVSKRGIVLHDPAIGEKRVSWGEVSKHLTGLALELTPTESFERRTSGRGCVFRRSCARRAEQSMRSCRFSPCHSRSSFSSSPGPSICSLRWTRSSPGAMSTC